MGKWVTRRGLLPGGNLEKKSRPECAEEIEAALKDIPRLIMIMPKNGLNEEARESLNDFQIQLSDAHAGPWHRFWSAALLILFLACPAFGTTYYLDIGASAPPYFNRSNNHGW